MIDVIGPYTREIEQGELTILDVVPYPPHNGVDTTTKTYRIKAVFRDAKNRTLRRMTLIIDRMKDGGISQDAGNLAHYYLNRRIVPKFIRKRFSAHLSADGKIQLKRPDGSLMPGGDVKLMAFNFSPL